MQLTAGLSRIQTRLMRKPLELLYVCDSSQPHFGFRCWDAFFIRKFRDGVRPVAAPGDGGPFSFPSVGAIDLTAVIVSPCKLVTYWRLTAVQARDTFCLKGQPYSLLEMLDYDVLAPRFLQGTVHQSWIEAEAYYYWHAPVVGRIVKAVHVLGSFFAQLPSQGFSDPYPTGQNLLSRYPTVVATRCLISIEADNSDIGLMCFIVMGMMEISSSEITVQPDQHVAKDEQISMFHYGAIEGIAWFFSRA